MRTMPKFRSTDSILLFAPGLRSLLLIIFSTASTTPSLHRIPIAVPPFSTAFDAYSTCKCLINQRFPARLNQEGYGQPYLEISAVWGEGRIRQIVPSAYGRLEYASCLVGKKSLVSASRPTMVAARDDDAINL